MPRSAGALTGIGRLAQPLEAELAGHAGAGHVGLVVMDLDGWLWYYNHQRKHSALGHKPPVARLNEQTNLLGTYT